ncbi:MAG: retroviral-like aspartic protease family protein [Candidatus Woesearchaeota archaeon]
MESRIVLGLIEPVKILIGDNQEPILARIDTGAERSSIDHELALKLGVEKQSFKKRIRTVLGRSIRELANINLELADQKLESQFSICDRSHMNYKVLIGQDILKKGNFIIDPLKITGKEILQ